MVKTNLPIIFLRKVIALPNNEMRLEIDTELDKQVLGMSEQSHDGHILLINLKDRLEEKPLLSELPKIGVIGKIKSRIELPNGIVRVVITGLDRVEVLNYFNNDELNTKEAIVIPTKLEEYDEFELAALRRILLRDLNNYIEVSMYMSNSVIGRTTGVKSLGILSDIIASEMPLSYEEKLKYVYNTNYIDRTRMIIEDLNKELETLKIESDIENELKRSLDKSQKDFILREKMKIIKEELGDSDYKEEDANSLKEKIDDLLAPDKVKWTLIEEVRKYELAPATSPEITIIRNYINWLLSLPWYEETKDNDNIEDIKNILDKSHYGLKEIKDRIIEYIAVSKSTNGKMSNIICLVGPPGTGKTSLAKSIATALNKKYVKISVGGINDEAEIMGHRRTYIGASPGKIIAGMKKAGSRNPVFLIDEIDKMTKDYRGDPASALLDVLDKEQNNIFTDNYIEEAFDLSKVMFILTANTTLSIPGALKDRLEIIELSSYTYYEKLDIAKKHLIPTLLEEYNIEPGKISFDDGSIMKIIKNYTLESGVRELERTISKIMRKILVKMLGKHGKEKFQVKEKNLVDYLGKEKYVEEIDKDNPVGVTNALVYTRYGGSVDKISCTMYEGTGKEILTGSLGKVLEESIKIAMSYIKSNSEEFKIDFKLFKEKDFHIHFEEGAVQKDGPSAGITIVTSLISLLMGKKVPSHTAMTGEMTLRGKVLPVGGIKEKLIGAATNNIETIYLSRKNESDVLEIDKEITKKLNIIYVEDYKEIYDSIFKKGK